MASHKCQTYDFPVKNDKFDYLISKTYAAGNKAQFAQAAQEAIKEAKDLAEKAGEDAMKGETCNHPVSGSSMSKQE